MLAPQTTRGERRAGMGNRPRGLGLSLASSPRATRSWPFVWKRLGSEGEQQNAPEDHIHTYTHADMCTHRHMSTQMQTCAHTEHIDKRHVHTQTHEHTGADTCTDMYTQTHMHAHTHTHMHTHAQSNAHTQSHTHLFTHTHTHPSLARPHPGHPITTTLLRMLHIFLKRPFSIPWHCCQPTNQMPLEQQGVLVPWWAPHPTPAPAPCSLRTGAGVVR